MDRESIARHPSRSPRRAYSIDGFVPNRRGRTIGPSPNAIKKSASGPVHSSNKLIGDGFTHMSSKSQASITQPAGAAWAPRLQDPSDVELSRKPKRKSKQGRLRRLKSLRWKKIALRSGLGLLTVVVVVGGFVGYKFAHNIDKVFGGNVFSNLGSLFNNVTLRGQSTGRINILLAGDSADQINHGGADLTDSILILSVNTNNHTAFLLSIPRDLWVQMPNGVYPGGTYQKINAANDITNFSMSGYPNGGMGALSYIIQNDLGIPIDYYGVMDYGAFKDSVNAVGGVSVDIQSPSPYGLYDPNTNLKLPNGWVNLNGQQALNLARARGDGYGSYGFPDSDFDRTEHQRQIFVAVAQKAESIGVLSNPAKITSLFDALGNNFQTNLSLSDVLALVHLTKNVNPNTIKSYAYCSTETVGQDGCKTPILMGYVDPKSGEDALVPTTGIGNYAQMELYYEQLTSNNPVVNEAASVTILNGGNTAGLAKAYQSVLVPKGVDVGTIADASSTYPQTEIVNDSSGKDPNTLKLLESTFGNNVVANSSALNPAGVNFVVILGTNQGEPGSSQSGSSN